MHPHSDHRRRQSWTTIAVAAVLSLSAAGTAAVPEHPASSSGAPALTLTLTPSAIVGGNGVAATLVLSAPAPAGGTAVTLRTSDIGLAALVSPILGPSSALAFMQVTIPAAESSLSVQVRTFGVAATATVSISGATTTSSAAATLTVNPASVQAVTVSPAGLVGGSRASGRITLDGAAPSSGGATARLSLLELVGASRVRTSAASVPATVAVDAGARFGQFTIGSVPTATPRSLLITATLNRAAEASFSVSPPSVADLRIGPASVVAGSAATGSVVLDGVAPAEGHSVHLRSSDAAVSVPATIAIRPGAKSGSFKISTGQVAAPVKATIHASNAPTAATGDGSPRALTTGRSASLTVVPLQVASLRLVSPLATTVATFGGRSVPGTVILSGPAPTGGVAVTLISGNDDVAAVPRLSIPAGSDRVSFSFGTAAVSVVTRVTIGAAVNAGAATDGTSNTLLFPEEGQASAEVVLLPVPQLQSVAAAPSPVTGGDALTVALSVLIAGGAGINVPVPVATAHISVDRPDLVQLVATVSVPGYQLVPRAVPVTGTTSPAATDQTATITVTLEGRTASTTVVVRAVTPGPDG